MCNSLTQYLAYLSGRQMTLIIARPRKVESFVYKTFLLNFKFYLLLHNLIQIETFTIVNCVQFIYIGLNPSPANVENTVSF
jgi:hypothetical protein